MKSTKDNRPAVKFSDIVKELHSYANSEQAVIDFASELEKVINLSEEFELSQYYFEDNDAKNYLRKKLNFKSVILTGIKSSTTTISNIKDDFFEIYKNCYHKYVKSGNPFFNRLSIMYDLNLYYDIEQKKFVIYEATNVGYPGDFEFYSKKDFYGTYINRVDSIFPVSISDRGQNSNLLFIRPMDSLESIPMSITCNFDVVLLKYISGLIDTKEFSAEFLKDINSYIESVVKNISNFQTKLLDWVPTRVLLTKKIDHLELENKYNTEVIKVQNLYDFREDVVSMLLFKDMLEFAGADYVSCCVVETLYADNDDYTIDSDDKFRKLLKVSLGKNIEFLEYAGKNLNKDVYEQSKKSNLIHISAPKFKI